MDLYWHRLRGQPVLAATGAVLFLVIALGASYLWRSQAEPIDQQLPQATALARSDPRVVAHAAGAVMLPGLYDLPAYSRVADLIEVAGGPSADADLDQLNLAEPLRDGSRIYVPVEGETQIASLGSEGTGPLNLNTATQNQLEALAGVGPSTAAAIIDWREEHGPFGTVEELLSVPGIGPAKLAQLSDDVIAG